MRRKNITPIFLNSPKQTISGAGDILSRSSGVDLIPSQNEEVYNVPDGAVNGQVLNITNKSENNYSASLSVSSAFVSQHETVVVAAGSIATLLWTGALWVLINNTGSAEAAGAAENALWFTYPSPFGVNVDPNPVDESPQSTSFGSYVFALESSGGTDALDPDSKLWVFDVSSSASNPPKFSWSPPSSDVPDFKNANEIIINEDDIFIVYYWRNPTTSDGDWDYTNPSRIVKFSGVSIDFAGSNITYSSAEVVEITNGVAIHGVTKDSTHIYMSQRGTAFGAGSSDLAIFRAPLSGTLSVDRFEVIDGGPKPDGTQYEWYGSLRTGGYDDYEGTDFLGSDDIKSHGDYLYLNCDVHVVRGEKTLFLDESQGWTYWRSAVGRIPKSNLSAPIEVVFVHDNGGLAGGMETNGNVLTTKGNYLFSAQGSRANRGLLAKIDLTDPTQYKSIDRPGRGGPHSIEVWGDNLVITNQYSNSQQYPYISVVRQSDLSEIAFLSLENYLGLTGAYSGAVTDDVAIYGDYAYLALEFNGAATPTILSVDLNNVTESGVTTLQNLTNDPFSATHSGMII